MAKCLLDVKDQVTSKLRILNPYKTEAFIRQDANIAEAEECTPIETIESLKLKMQSKGKTTAFWDK